MTRHLRALATLTAAAIECAGILAVGCAYLTILVLSDAEPEVDLDPEPDDPCRWAEFRANVAVNEAGRLLADIEALRAADDVVGLVVR